MDGTPSPGIVRKTSVILVARSEAFSGRKATKKLMQEIKIRFRDQPQVFWRAKP
jgi:hypothetical protein